MLFFGDLFAAGAATVGLNPAWREYLDAAGQELTGEQRRFETLGSLGAAGCCPTGRSLTDQQVDQAVGRMRRYFHGNVYVSWFSRPGRVLEGAGHSYTDDAVHLDVVQEATDPTWSSLQSSNPDEHNRLRDQDLPFLGWLLETFPLRLVLADGRTVSEVLAELTGADLQPIGTLGRLKIQGCRHRHRRPRRLRGRLEPGAFLRRAHSPPGPPARCHDR